MNPTKRAHFRVFEAGLQVLDPNIVAFVQIPTVTIETAEHTEANHKVETPVLINVEEFEIGLFEDQTQRNNFWLAKIPYVQDTGAFKTEAEFRFDLEIQQMAGDLTTPIRKFQVKGCLAKQRKFEQSERTSKDNQIRTILCKPKQLIETPL